MDMLICLYLFILLHGVLMLKFGFRVRADVIQLTKYNPATGLPMMPHGELDIQGNPYGIKINNDI